MERRKLGCARYVECLVGVGKTVDTPLLAPIDS